MKYRLTIRSFNENDTSAECPFEPDRNEFEIYLVTLVEDIEKIDDVSRVLRNQTTIEIYLRKEMEKSELKEKMAHIFTEIFCKLRFVSLDVDE